MFEENNMNAINKIENSAIVDLKDTFIKPNDNSEDVVKIHENFSVSNTSGPTDSDSFIPNAFESENNINIENVDVSDKVIQNEKNTRDKVEKQSDLENKEEPVSENPLSEKDESDVQSDSEEILQNRKDKVKKKFILHDSDSESEPTRKELDSLENEQLTDGTQNLSELSNKKNHKRLRLVDSDSESETENVPNVTVDNNETEISNITSKGDVVVEKPEFSATPNKWSALCDSDSSDDDDMNNSEEVKNNQPSDVDDMTEPIIPKPYKKKSKRKNEDEPPKKMTGKDAAVLKKEIKSESQRMVREMNVSLPYHRPKQFTLQEFLSRRPKLSSVVPLPSQVPASVAILMATQQLDVISEKLKERQKQIREFYKSESESSEDDNDKDYVPPSEEQQKNNSISEKGDNINEILNDHKQEFPEKKQISTDYGIGSSSIEINVSVNEVCSDITELNEENSHSNNTNSDSGVILCENDKNETLNHIKNKEIECSEKNDIDKLENPIEVVNDKTEDFNADTENSKDDSLSLEHNKEDTSMKVDEDINNHSVKKFQYGELDKEIESFGSKQNEEMEVKLGKMELLKQKLSNIKPRLSGGPNEIIDLETGTTQPDEITKLKERFIQQTTKKPTHKSKVKLNITSVESGEIHKETVAINVEDDESAVIEEVPGVRMRKLRDELQNQITRKRLELWQNKTLKSKTEDELAQENATDKEGYEAGVDILDNDEEENMSESSEEEEVEEDEDVEEKPRKKSVFVDDEAQESDQECEMDELRLDDDTQEKDVEKEGKEDEVDEDDDDDDDDEDDNDDEDNDNTEEPIGETIKKPLKRILKGFTEDSEDEDDESEKIIPDAFAEIDKNDETQDDKITPNQEQHSQTSIKSNPITQQKSFEFLTPISYITGLQNLNTSASKNRKASPIASVFRMPSVPSPLKESNWQSNLQKKLFNDAEITNSQLADMAELCSANLTDSQVFDKEKEYEIGNNTEDKVSIDSSDITPSGLPSTQELLNICSGGFDQTANTCDNINSDSEISQVLAGTSEPSTQDLLNICSGDFNATVENTNIKSNNIERHTLNQTREVKNLDVDQDIISQLIDEEEMENFKKKFDSPMLTHTQKRILEEFEEREVANSGVIDSDDDDEDASGIKRKRNKKKLMFSDDESSENEEYVDQEEEINLHDEDNESDEENDVPDNVDYDSEENEVEFQNVNQERKNLKCSDFFEAEAELSESEWGSADEDEKDMDDLEFEQGDNEQFDEKKLRTDLEKIHMRRMLDDDNREVKLLQELLLEDGELHGTGRERQFRWKNIDSMGTEEEETMKKDDDVYLDEEESEEQWRKKRYEREMFLKEKEKKLQLFNEEDDLLSDSQLLRIGHQIISRSNSNSQQNTPVEKEKEKDITEPVVKASFSLFQKRGSFLSRGPETLQRLARFNNITTTTTVETGQTAKNSRKFLFQTVSVEETSVVQNKKRKAETGTPNVIKKLRLTENFSPANRRKKSAMPSARTKLFGGQTDVSQC